MNNKSRIKSWWRWWLLLSVGAVSGGCVAVYPSPPERTISVAPAATPPGPVTTAERPLAAALAPPLKVTVTEAILLALSNNRALAVARYAPRLSRTAEAQAAAVFDPKLTAQASAGRTRTWALSTQGAARSVAEEYAVEGGVTQYLPTGTTVAVTGDTTVSPLSAAADGQHASGLGLSVTQSLLRGYGPDANLASLHQARLDTLLSEYELRGYAETLLAQTEETYWDYVLAQRQISIVTESLALAEQQLEETRERVRVGKLAETELAASQAEIASRRVDLINARSTLAKTRVQLLRLLNPDTGQLDRELATADEPAPPAADLGDVRDHVQVADRMRADVNQARLRICRGNLDLVKTRNGLLPKLDLFMNLGRSGYAASFGGSWPGSEQDNYNVTVGVSLEYALGNHEAIARHERAVLSHEQQEEALRNLTQLAEVDVRVAHLEALRANEAVAATAATRRLQEETLRVETAKFQVDKSTSLLVAQAQRNLVASQLNEISAIITGIKAVTELYRLEGSLLERRGIATPGSGPPAAWTSQTATP